MDVNGQESGEDMLRRWVNLYQTQALRMSYVLLGDVHKAEDAVQDAFLRAYQRRDTLRDQTKEKTWLMTIVTNVCRGYRRSWWIRHVNQSMPVEEIVISQSFSEEETLLHLEVERLPYRQKEVILLYYYQGMNVREISRALQISQSSVSERLERARNQLKKAMEDEQR